MFAGSTRIYGSVWWITPAGQTDIACPDSPYSPEALCRATEFMAGIECIGMEAEAVPFGTLANEGVSYLD